jgi:hypothetical protein
MLALGGFGVGLAPHDWFLLAWVAATFAASTLAATGLFNPLLQAGLQVADQHFNHARFNAERDAELAAPRRRAAVGVATIGHDLTRAVARTVQPGLGGLWVRESR